MNPTPTQWLPYAVILAGTGLAFFSAVTPHYDTGHLLMTSVLLAGLSPYLLYGMAATLMKGMMIFVAGLVLLALHGALVLREYLATGIPPADNIILYGPVVLAIVLSLPLLLRALREPWR